MNDRVLPGSVVAVVIALIVAAIVAVAGGPVLAPFFSRASGTPAPRPTAVGPVTAPPGSSRPGPSSASPPAGSFPANVAGLITFGRGPGPDACSVSDSLPAEPFAAVGNADSVYVSAILLHPVATLRGVKLYVIGSTGILLTLEATQDPAHPQCWGSSGPVGPFEAGQYVFAVRRGDETESTGILLVE